MNCHDKSAVHAKAPFFCSFWGWTSTVERFWKAGPKKPVKPHEYWKNRGWHLFRHPCLSGCCKIDIFALNVIERQKNPSPERGKRSGSVWWIHWRKRYPPETRAQKSKIEKPAARELLTAGVGGADTLDAVVNTSILTQKEKSPNANCVQTQSGKRWQKRYPS